MPVVIVRFEHNGGPSTRKVRAGIIPGQCGTIFGPYEDEEKAAQALRDIGARETTLDAVFGDWLEHPVEVMGGWATADGCFLIVPMSLRSPSELG